MRRRLAEPLGPDGYQVVRSNFQWRDHEARLLATAAAVSWLKPSTVIDPACGDASIVTAANRLNPIDRAFLSDISQPQIDSLDAVGLPYRASLLCGDAIKVMSTLPVCDLVVLTEILEHVESPEAVLSMAYHRAGHLVASSPLNEDPGVGNHEHVWSWDKQGYREMLESVGWVPVAYQEVSFYVPGWPYAFQIWTCRR